MNLLTEGVFGRTNERVPRLWFGLMPGGDPAELVREVASEPAVVDVSGHAGLFGHLLHGVEVQTASFGGLEIENAGDANHAATLVGAHLVETLSSIGRSTLDYYFLRVRKRLREEQVLGALNVLDEAKGEGTVRFIGLYVEGDGSGATGMWQFHDAFEVAMADRNPAREEVFGAVKGMARERRVGLASSRPFNWGKGLPFFEMPGQSFEVEGAGVLSGYLAEHPVLVGVRSAEEVRGCRAALGAPVVDPDGFLAEYENCDFRELEGDERGWVREAAGRLNRVVS